MARKVLVYGLGVIGSVYAVRLAKAGVEVSVLARGERLAALRSGGLRIRNVFLDLEESAPVEALEALDPSARYDLVLVTVRSGQILSALKDVARLPGPGAVAVIGNNLGDLREQAVLAGEDRLVPGFGAFGGYRDGEVIAYLDGRTREKPGADRIGSTTLGTYRPSGSRALAAVRSAFSVAGLPVRECPDMRAWFLYHAALVFPLAGALYAAGGGQDRVCRTRDAQILGIRACRELFSALGTLGFRMTPARLRTFAVLPERLILGTLRRALSGEGARIALFGHANAPGGRSEIGSQALVLDGIVRPAGRPMPAWDRLLPYFPEDSPEPLLAEGSRNLRLRLW